MSHKILSVTVNSIKGCKLAEVPANQQGITVIGGDNANGKSSFLDAICMALGGKRLFPKEPIEEGKDEGTVSVKLGGESTHIPWPCTIYRTIMRSEDGGKITSRVTIEADDGEIAPSPQTILNDVLGGGLSFDPLKFIHDKPADQVNLLRQIVDLDFTELDEEYDRAYQQRTVQNRLAKQIEGKLKQTEIHVDVPTEKIDVAALVSELQDMDANNQQVRQEKAKAEEAKRAAETCKQRFEQIQERYETAKTTFEEKYKAAKLALEQQFHQNIKNLEAQYQDKTNETKAALEANEAVVSAYSQSANEIVDTSIIQQKIANAGETNRKWDENAKRLDTLAEARQHKEASKAFTKRLKEIEKQKQEMADAVDWPIQGLGFGPDGVVMNGLPFSNLSSKEQLTISVALALKLNPIFPFAIIRDGSLLDADAMELLNHITVNHDGQVFVERVSKGSECHVVFEQGLAKRV